jgi:hypothetical protein
MAPFIAATVFALPVGTAVALLTWYAQGKDNRLDEMLDRR